MNRGLAGNWAERVRSAFEENFTGKVEVGAAVAIWQAGAEVLSLYGGWRDAARSLP